MTDERLCKKVERVLGRHMESPQDFVWLSEEVAKSGKGTLSVNTLKRLWGYLDNDHATRRSTLDILAQFIGYRDYVSFCREEEEDERKERKEEKEEKEERKEKRLEEKGEKVRWIGALLIVVAAIGFIAGSFYLMNRPSEPVYVTDLSQLSPNKQYYIHTRNKARGSLGVACRFMSTTFSQAAQHRCEEPSTFAIIKHKGAYYLYSVKDKRFIDYGQCERKEPLSCFDCAFTIHQEADSCFVFDNNTGKAVCTLNVNSAYGPHCTNYGTVNEMYDDGNLFMLEEAGDFDPTEALAMMQKRPDPEYEAALKKIKAGKYYISPNPSPVGDGNHKKRGGSQQRLYLRADGRLTETLTDSCIFDICLVEQNTEEATPYRLPAWRITHTSEDGVKATAFGTPQDEMERYIPHLRHLRTDAATGDSWQDKVLYLGPNGCYAIRATNVPIETWGAALYWAVYDLDNDGRPEADYSDDRTYIWHLVPMK